MKRIYSRAGTWCAMPVLAFVPSLSLLIPSRASVGQRTLIQVSAAAFDLIAPILELEGPRLTVASLPMLRYLLASREFDSELELLIAAIEQRGGMYATFV
jgi:hypothetical protein